MCSVVGYAVSLTDVLRLYGRIGSNRGPTIQEFINQVLKIDTDICDRKRENKAASGPLATIHAKLDAV